MARPAGPVRTLRTALPGLALALGLVAPGQGAAQGLPPPIPAPVPVAAAYAAAWNAHDLPAVLALFAPDAVVRERRGEVPPHVWDSRDRRVVEDYLDTASDGPNYNPSNLVWVTGHQEIAAWAAGHFAQHHRYVAGPSRAAGATVNWPYRAFVDPFQRLPGVGPLDGDAEAVVRSGRIVVLSLVLSPASVQRRHGEVEAAGAGRVATYRASLRGAGSSLPLSGPRRADPVAEPAPVGWPLALGGLALLVAVTAARRRRGGDNAAGCNRTTPGG